MIQITGFRQASWQCIHFKMPESIESLKIGLAEVGFLVNELDSSSIIDDETLFSIVSDALNFPDYFGRNWNAMDECLADLDLSTSTGLVLIINNASYLWGNSTYSAGKFVSAWQTAAERWGIEKKPFHLCFVV